MCRKSRRVRCCRLLKICLVLIGFCWSFMYASNNGSTIAASSSYSVTPLKLSSSPLSSPLPDTSAAIKVWFIWSVTSLDTWHWMPLACIESVVTFHPAAEVVVLSNSLPLDFFSCFQQLGRGGSVRVQRYSIIDLVEGTFLENFVVKGLWAASVNSTFRYAHE